MSPRLSKRTVIWSALAGSVLMGASFAWKPLLVRHRIVRAREALLTRDATSALEWLRANERLAPDHAETHFWLARAFRRLGRYDQVREHLDRARKLGFSVERLKREQWLALAQSGQIQAAEQHLASLLQDPRNDGREICEAYVAGYLLNYRFEPAHRLIDAWRNDYPGDPYPYLILGRVFESQSNTTKAVANYRKALERDNGQQEARLRLANLLMSLHKHEEARANYLVCLHADRNDVEVLLGWSRWLMVTARHDEARRILSRILSRDPKNPAARTSMGQLELAAGNPRRAAEWLEPLATEFPRDSKVRYVLARTLQRLGQTDRAKVHFDFADNALKAAQRVQILMERLDRDPSNVALRYEIGTILMHYGNSADAAAWLQSVLQLAPNHQRAHAALAKHYERFGPRELAKRHRALAGGLKQ